MYKFEKFRKIFYPISLAMKNENEFIMGQVPFRKCKRNSMYPSFLRGKKSTRIWKLVFFLDAILDFPIKFNLLVDVFPI